MRSAIWVVGAALAVGGMHACTSGTSPPPSGQDGGVDAGGRTDAGGVSDAGGGRDVPARDAATACGNVTQSGECVGNLLRYCDNGMLIESDCGSRARTCALQSALGGYWCVGPVGSACDVNDTDVCASTVSCVDNVCGGPVADAGPTADAGSMDGGTPDAAAAADAGAPTDAGPGDGGAGDAGSGDAGPADGGAGDAGVQDASGVDAG